MSLDPADATHPHSAKGELGGIDQKPGQGEMSGALDPAAEVEKPKRRRSKPIVVDGVRTVNYYRFTTHELDMIAEPQRDAARAGAISAFAFGLFVTTLGSLQFGKANSPVIEAAWTIGAIASIAFAVYYLIEAIRLRRRANTRLQAIKDEHDFT